MAEDINGIEEPDDIESKSDAAIFLGIGVDASDDEVDDAFQSVVLDAHPDSGGTTELFKAAKKARDGLKGEIILPAEASDPGGVADQAHEYDPRKSRDISDEHAEDIVDSVEEMLREEMTLSELRDKYTEETDFRELAEIIASIIIQGGANLGDIGKMVGSNPHYSDSVSSATGGVYSKGGDPRYGGTDTTGGNPNYSSDPSDYMG